MKRISTPVRLVHQVNKTRWRIEMKKTITTALAVLLISLALPAAAKEKSKQQAPVRLEQRVVRAIRAPFRSTPSSMNPSGKVPRATGSPKAILATAAHPARRPMSGWLLTTRRSMSPPFVTIRTPRVSSAGWADGTRTWIPTGSCSQSIPIMTDGPGSFSASTRPAPSGTKLCSTTSTTTSPGTAYGRGKPMSTVRAGRWR